MDERVLAVIDMQNDFIDGSLGTPEAQKIVKPVADFMLTFHKDNDIVFCTKDTHFDTTYFNTQEGKKLPIPHCIYGTKGHDFPEAIKAASEYVNALTPYKQTFGYNNWGNFDISPKEIIVCGLCTDICVIANAVLLKTFFPEVPIVVMKDLCAGTTPEAHQKALDVMKSLQIEVR